MVEKEAIEDLALLLLYLSCWDENPKNKCGEKPILRAWKNIRFEVLDSLSEKGLLTDSKKSKSVLLTEEGIKKVKDLEKKFFSEVKNE